MSISDLRFTSVQALRSATKNVPLARFTRARDKKGYYIADYELDPIMQELFKEMGAAVEKVAARNKGLNPPPPPPADKPTPGPVQRVRDWAKAHPKATREQALEHFSDLNPATVRIQFSKVRKTQ